MSFLNSVIESIALFFPVFGTAAIVGAFLWGAHELLIKRHQDLGNERLFPRQLVMLGLTFVGLIAVALALPVGESTRNQLIAIIGLVISGLFAFSSSTIFSNIMAGTMLRVTRPFQTGDFIEVGSVFGRVVERGLLDTEIQTENQELVAFPNTYLITNPISVTRGSGCIVSATLSLGYDIHHATVESLLLDAARRSELDEPFVQVLDLGNDSITYKVSAILPDVKSLLTSRSNLRRNILDVLHGAGVEIVSPAFMNQRRMPDDLKVIPVYKAQQAPESGVVAEEVVFDKAEKAVQREQAKQQLLDRIQGYTTKLDSAPKQEKKRLQDSIREFQEQLKALQQSGVESTRDEPDAESGSRKGMEPSGS